MLPPVLVVVVVPEELLVLLLAVEVRPTVLEDCEPQAERTTNPATNDNKFKFFIFTLFLTVK